MKTLVRLAALFAGLLIAGMAQAQADSPRVWVSTSTTQIAAGQTLTVDVQVGQTVGVYGGSFKLNYDAQALEVVLTSDNKAVTPGSFFGSQPNFTLTNRADAGLIEYALTLTQPAEPVSGDGILGSITFRALQDATVTLTPTEARLLSPEFAEVDGRKIARKINEVQTQVEGLTLTVGAGGSVAPAATLMPTSAPVMVTQAAPQPVMLQQPPVMAQPVVNPVLLIGAALFIIGLGLFAISLGAYVSMRRQFALPDQEVGLW